MKISKPFKRPDSSFWQIRINVDGKSVCKSLKTKDEGTAYMMASSLQKGRVIIRYKEAVEKFMFHTYNRRDGWAIKYKQGDQSNDYHCSYVLKKVYEHNNLNPNFLYEITQEHLDDYVNSIPHTPNTINKHIVHIRKFYNYCHHNNWIAVNLGGLIIKKKLIPKIPYSFSMEELNKIYNYADSVYNGRYKSFFELMYETGLRPTDAFHLTQKDFIKDDVGLTINIIQRKTKHPLIVPISPRAEEIVLSKGKILFPWAKSVYERELALKVLKNSFGLWNRFCKKNKITLHQFRHTFGMHKMAKGISLELLKDLMGHKYLSQTELYAHAMPKNSLREALSR
jgi:site-specific recombinase XerD